MSKELDYLFFIFLCIAPFFYTGWYINVRKATHSQPISYENTKLLSLLVRLFFCLSQNVWKCIAFWPRLLLQSALRTQTRLMIIINANFTAHLPFPAQFIHIGKHCIVMWSQHILLFYPPVSQLGRTCSTCHSCPQEVGSSVDVHHLRLLYVIWKSLMSDYIFWFIF